MDSKVNKIVEYTTLRINIDNKFNLDKLRTDLQLITKEFGSYNKIIKYLVDFYLAHSER